MLQKNVEKLRMKKRRNTWTCSRPVTQVVPNRKKKTRQQLRKELKDIVRSEGRLMK